MFRVDESYELLKSAKTRQQGVLLLFEITVNRKDCDKN